jgi:hypothetical protein
MSSKEPTLIEQKARELAVAIKDDIIAKIKSGKFLYRSDHKWMVCTRPDDDMLLVGEVHKDIYSFIREGIESAMEKGCVLTSYRLHSGCWGVSKSPIGNTMVECTRNDLERYFKIIADEACKIVKEVVKDKYKETARELGFMRKPSWDYE